jgi:SAM-dependent methyltransferase
MSNVTTSQDFFEAKYQDEIDPWHFADSDYEQSRYAAITSCLKGTFFPRAFEPGCSIGVLTEKLAEFCGELYAIDISDTAAHRAAERCKHLSNVFVGQGCLPFDIPCGVFDLIVLSEIGYYYDEKALAEMAANLVSRLSADGVLLAAHWLGNSPDHLLSGDQVHETLSRAPGMRLVWRQRFPEFQPGFRIDLWARA